MESFKISLLNQIGGFYININTKVINYITSGESFYSCQIVAGKRNEQYVILYSARFCTRSYSYQCSGRVLLCGPFRKIDGKHPSFSAWGRQLHVHTIVLASGDQVFAGVLRNICSANSRKFRAKDLSRSPLWAKSHLSLTSPLKTDSA